MADADVTHMRGDSDRRTGTVMHSLSATDSTFRPALLLMSGRTVGFVATFFVPVVLARVVDQSDFGTYRLFFLIYSTLCIMTQFGMAESLFYFLPGAGETAGRYVANSFVFLAAAGGVCYALLEMANGAISRWLHNDALPQYMTLLAAFLGLMLASAGLEIVMTARRRYLWASASYGASDVARAAFLIVPAVLLGRLDAVLAGAVAFALLRLAATLGYFAHAFRRTMRVDARLLGEQLLYAGPFSLAIVLETLQGHFHQYAVSYSFDAATFAVYSVGCLQIPFVDTVATSTWRVLMVRMAEARREGRQDRMLELWHDATRKLALVFFPLVAMLLVAAHEVIILTFTEQYGASVPVFMISTTAIALSFLATDGVLRVYAQTGFLMALNAVRLVLVAALFALFVAIFHLPGAMLAAVLAGAVAKGLALVRISRLMGVGVDRLLPWRSLGATAIAAAIAALAGLTAKAFLGGTPLSALTAATVAAAVVYAALALRLGLLREGERVTLTGWRHGLVGRAHATARSKD